MERSPETTYHKDKLVFNLFRFFLFTGLISTFFEIYFSSIEGRAVIIPIVMAIVFTTFLMLVHRYPGSIKYVMILLLLATYSGTISTYVLQGGMQGIAPYLVISNLLIYTILFDGILKKLAVALFLVSMFILIQVPGLFPGQTMTPEIPFNINSSFIPFMIFMVGIIIYLKNSLLKSIDEEENSKTELERLNKELNNKSEELSLSQKELIDLNLGLEDIATRKAERIEKRNEQLAEYAYVNAHLLRAPLTRVMGLTSLLSINHQSSKLIQLKEKAEKTDQIVKKINELLK